MTKLSLGSIKTNQAFRSFIVLVIGCGMLSLIGVVVTAYGASLLSSGHIPASEETFIIYLVIILIFAIIPAISGVIAGCILGIRGGIIGGAVIGIFILCVNIWIGMNLIVSIILSICVFGISGLCGLLTEQKQTPNTFSSDI